MQFEDIHFDCIEIKSKWPILERLKKITIKFGKTDLTGEIEYTFKYLINLEEKTLENVELCQRQGPI